MVPLLKCVFCRLCRHDPSIPFLYCSHLRVSSNFRLKYWKHAQLLQSLPFLKIITQWANFRVPWEPLQFPPGTLGRTLFPTSQGFDPLTNQRVSLVFFMTTIFGRPKITRAKKMQFFGQHFQKSSQKQHFWPLFSKNCQNRVLRLLAFWEWSEN